ncbi:MAG: 50S ribosomal protein L18 [Ignavibacteriae bacterium HGW-Ignavibacteriae-4]|jgi:large subunit ribosomal protein L18|nr:MAG: 50S ribosomal protein L18 [Ignavibacteriae bacterium HGW-Ignavibacteriae-4]
MNTTSLKYKRKARRKRSIKSKIRGTASVPRLSVFKSLTNIFVQIIDDTNAVTLVSASTIDPEVKSQIKSDMTKTQLSQLVGKAIAERAVAKDIKQVRFDRNGNLYTGRVKALADSAREGGLQF